MFQDVKYGRLLGIFVILVLLNEQIVLGNEEDEPHAFCPLEYLVPEERVDECVRVASGFQEADNVAEDGLEFAVDFLELRRGRVRAAAELLLLQFIVLPFFPFKYGNLSECRCIVLLH